MFLTPSELNLIHVDADIILHSPEATQIEICYRVHEFQKVDPQPAFGIVDRRELTDEVIKCQHGCLQHLVKNRNAIDMQYGWLEVGDCVFFISTDIDLTEPIAGYRVAKGTLYIVDPNGVKWIPKPTVNEQEAKAYALAMIGDSQIMQTVFCSLER